MISSEQLFREKHFEVVLLEVSGEKVSMRNGREKSVLVMEECL